MADTNVKMRSLMITDKNGYTIHAKIEDTGSETGKVDAYDEIIFDKDADLSKFNKDELREQIGTRLSNYKEYSAQTKFDESADSLPDKFENGVRYNVGLFTSAKPAPAATKVTTQADSTIAQTAQAQITQTTQAAQASATTSATTSTSFPFGNSGCNLFNMFNDGGYGNYCNNFVIPKDTPGLSLGSYIGVMSGNMGLFDFSFMTAMCDLLKGLFCFGNNTTTTTTSSNTDTQKAAVATSTATATTAAATTEAKTTPKASDDIASVNIIEEEKEPADGNGAASAPTPPKHRPHSGNRLHKKVATPPKEDKSSCKASDSPESQKLDDKWKTLTNIASHINEPGQSVSEQQSRIAYYTKDHPDVFGSNVLTKESYESTDSPTVRANKVRINNLIDKMNSVLDPSTKIDGKDYKKAWVQSEIQRVNLEIEQLRKDLQYNNEQRNSKLTYNPDYKKYDDWGRADIEAIKARGAYVRKLQNSLK